MCVSRQSTPRAVRDGAPSERPFPRVQLARVRTFLRPVLRDVRDRWLRRLQDPDLVRGEIERVEEMPLQ